MLSKPLPTGARLRREPLTELEADADGFAAGETTFDDPPLERFATGPYYAMHT